LLITWPHAEDKISDGYPIIACDMLNADRAARLTPAGWPKFDQNYSLASFVLACE
jgi:hypothetical protein